MATRIPTTSETLCDVQSNQCTGYAEVDLGTYTRFVGLPGEVRYLCRKHVAGSRAARVLQD